MRPQHLMDLLNNHESMEELRQALVPEGLSLPRDNNYKKNNNNSDLIVFTILLGYLKTTALLNFESLLNGR